MTAAVPAAAVAPHVWRIVPKRPSFTTAIQDVFSKVGTAYLGLVGDAWELTPPVVDAGEIQEGDWPMEMGEPMPNGDAAYHDFDGLPFAAVAVDDANPMGCLPAALHEAGEGTVNPEANLTVPAIGGGPPILVEICDPFGGWFWMMDDQYQVPDFAFPAYFLEGQPGPYDFRNDGKAPQVPFDGYQFTAAGLISQVLGTVAPDKLAAIKAGKRRVGHASGVCLCGSVTNHRSAK